MFSLEKLKVYDRALASVASLAQLSAHWDKRHAVVDQLQRASESVALNIAEGARLRSSPQRQHILDYAIGSTLECAACLNIAQCKQWVLQADALLQKEGLCEIVKMLFGLRRAWKGDELHEEAGGTRFGTRGSGGSFGSRVSWKYLNWTKCEIKCGIKYL